MKIQYTLSHHFLHTIYKLFYKKLINSKSHRLKISNHHRNNCNVKTLTCQCDIHVIVNLFLLTVCNFHCTIHINVYIAGSSCFFF